MKITKNQYRASLNLAISILKDAKEQEIQNAVAVMRALKDNSESLFNNWAFHIVDEK